MNWYALLIVIFATILGALGQIQMKKGTNKDSYFRIFYGLFLYGIAALITVYAFKFERLSVLYPITATSYIWGSLLASYEFGEKLNKFKIIGIIIIILGVSLVAF